ncbi:hypothetical protein L4C38_09385 [Vibrio kasasachensis]
MKIDSVNTDQQAQEKQTLKTRLYKWFWRIVRLGNLICSVVEFLEGGE